MTNPKHKPAVMRVLKSKANVVRQIASEQGTSYDETSVSGEDDVIRCVQEYGRRRQ
jgi:hypothetical protein